MARLACVEVVSIMEITQPVKAVIGFIFEPTTGCQGRTSILPITAAVNYLAGVLFS